MEYKDIEVKVGDKKLSVTYSYHENEEKKQICSISAAGKSLVVDEQQNILSNDMPEEWVHPILKVLTEIASGF